MPGHPKISVLPVARMQVASRTVEARNPIPQYQTVSGPAVRVLYADVVALVGTIDTAFGAVDL